jgi:hypothetical protein
MMNNMDQSGPLPPVADVLAKVADYQRRYAGTKSEARTYHDYFCLIACQVKVGDRAEHTATSRACLERIAAMALLALLRLDAQHESTTPNTSTTT